MKNMLLMEILQGQTNLNQPVKNLHDTHEGGSEFIIIYLHIVNLCSVMTTLGGIGMVMYMTMLMYLVLSE